MARKPANAEPDFETTLAKLETIVTKLESGELPLEDALKEFENGIKLAQLGQERFANKQNNVFKFCYKSETAPLSDYQGDE